MDDILIFAQFVRQLFMKLEGRIYFIVIDFTLPGIFRVQFLLQGENPSKMRIASKMEKWGKGKERGIRVRKEGKG